MKLGGPNKVALRVDTYPGFLIDGDEESKSLRVNCWIWNTDTLQWDRMTQPGINIDQADLTVSMGDVERLLAGSYWKSKQYDYTSGNLDYVGYNIDIAAEDDDTDWYVYKYTWVGENCTKIQGPAIGSWDGRAGLF